MKISGNLNVFVLFSLSCLATLTAGSDENGRKPYIVYMGDLPDDGEEMATLGEHHSLLSGAIGDQDTARQSLIHSYRRSINGFAANLLPHEASRLSDDESVVSVIPNTIVKLQTTRSWSFVGLSETSKRKPQAESDIIVGLLDSGIWMDSPSFDDKGFGPPPAKWKGKCEKGRNFTGCNNKVIGARSYSMGTTPDDPSRTPVDEEGHGTHTSSTAAGAVVRGASMYGLGSGTARGAVPSARIAMYKVCWLFGCNVIDILAGIDDAIADGVDIISLSLGGPADYFFNDAMAIGTFHAMKKGVFVSCAAGNDGPDLFSVTNVAPWVTTVAASSINRQFVANVKLGNGQEIPGISLNTFSPETFPLTDGPHGNNVTGLTARNISACEYGTLGENRVKGKVVYCLGTGQISTVRGVGATGLIMTRNEKTDVAWAFPIPATFVLTGDGLEISSYINSTQSPTAVIERTKTVKMDAAPFVASFSSRGPQWVTPGILKPDIAAPGLSILAAYTKMTSLTGYQSDPRYTKFDIMSGTSMACPHVSGAAAYVKTFHPDWSPAAIKSALMTTAKPMKTKLVDAELGSGAGHLNPTGALHPGLVYDISATEYISFLCKHKGYNSTTIGLLIGGNKNQSCSSFPRTKGSDGLNYPSMHIHLNKHTCAISAVFYRTVTNVGHGKSIYKAKVDSPKELSVTVVPNTLSFNRLHEKKSFKVTVKGKFIRNDSWLLSAALVWSDTRHRVTSPIVVYRPLF